MSREVRRVPLAWQHPMIWAKRWDGRRGRAVGKLVPRAMYDTTYADALTDWQRDRDKISARDGWDWEFWYAYCLTGYKGRDDAAEVIHPYDDGQSVRDADHLESLLLASHEESRPDPADHMPDFSDVPAAEMGLCMYETCSEGTPISPVFRTPEELARWLADNGASSFGDMTATYDQWLSVCRGGWAPSAVVDGSGLRSGVEFVAGSEVTA